MTYSLNSPVENYEKCLRPLLLKGRCTVFISLSVLISIAIALYVTLVYGLVLSKTHIAKIEVRNLFGVVVGSAHVGQDITIDTSTQPITQASLETWVAGLQHFYGVANGVILIGLSNQYSVAIASPRQKYGKNILALMVRRR